MAARSLAGEVVLVEDALVEPGREADVVDVALLEMDAAAELATRDVRVLPDQRLEQVGRLDGDRAAGPGHVEVGADVAAEVRQAESTADRRHRHRRPSHDTGPEPGASEWRPGRRSRDVIAPIDRGRGHGDARGGRAADTGDRSDAERGPAGCARGAIALGVSSLHPSLVTARADG